jgi:hypothetical protein
MAKRGQCRCGTLLSFELTSKGYKTRCPACKAVVRLRGDGPARQPRPHRWAAEDPTAAAPALPTAAPPDLSVLSVHESSAPVALAEIEVYHEPAAQSVPAAGGVRWWLLGPAIAGVMVAVGAAALLWG